MQKMKFKDIFFILRGTKTIQNQDKFAWINLVKFRKVFNFYMMLKSTL